MTTTPSPPSLDQLKDIGLFGGLDDDTLRAFADSLDHVRKDPGDVVFREGDSGRELYVVLGGELEILKKSKRQREARVAILGPNDWFGEMSILDVMPRSATVRVLAPTRMLRVSTQHLDGLYRTNLKAYSLVVLNIAREISRRLRVADGILAEMFATVMDDYPGRG